MTTEPRRGPRWNVDRVTLRLWVTAALSTTYLVAWWSFVPDRSLPPAAATPAPATAPPAEVSMQRSAGAPAFLWWHQLSPEARPALVVPSGWELVSPGAPARAALTPATVESTLATVRRPRPARRIRIRTRSS